MELCTPAHLFLVVSLLLFFFLSYNDYYNINASCMASYHCNKPQKSIVYYLLVLFLIFVWTFVLNFQCSAGFTTLVWIEILLPLLLMFLGYQINLDPYVEKPFYAVSRY